MEGEGIRDDLYALTKPIHGIPIIGPRIKHTLEGPREKATKRFTDFLNSKGSQPIVKLEIARKPVDSGIKKALNILSLGKLSRTAKKLSYDDIYHNYLIATMADGRQFIVEKNHVIEEREAKPGDLTNERYEIGLPSDRKLSLKEIIDKAATTDHGKPASAESVRKFYQYDASANNCQDFTKQVVEDNGLHALDPRAAELLKPQDGEKLVESLGPLAPIVKTLTDAAGSLDRLRHGDGVRPVKLHFYKGIT